MVYTELQTYAISEGGHILFCYVNDILSGLFMTLFFISIWFIVTFSSFFIQKRATGSGDFPVSASLGSFTTLICALLSKLVTCPYSPLVNNLTLGVIIGIMLISLLFLFFSKD